MTKKYKKGKEIGTGKTRVIDVMAMGSLPKKVKVRDTDTVREVLKRAGISGTNILADGIEVEHDEIIGNTQILNSLPKVKGGS